MKLFDVILLSLAAFFVIIAMYETMTVGIGQAYWLVMVALILFFAFNLRKRR
jgi:hypothetical protein